MARLKVFFEIWTKVATGVLLAAAIYCSLFFSEGMFSRYLLWQLLLVSFLTSLGTLLYTDTLDKKSMKIACLLHYLLNNVIVVGCGIWFGWIDATDFLQIIGMVVLVAMVFAVVSVISWKKAEKEANLMNERLARYQEQNEVD